MQCPYCEQEMEERVLESTHKIYLSKKPSKLGIPVFSTESKPLTGYGQPYFQVQYCKRCGKVIFNVTF